MGEVGSPRGIMIIRYGVERRGFEIKCRFHVGVAMPANDNHKNH